MQLRPEGLGRSCVQILLCEGSDLNMHPQRSPTEAADGTLGTCFVSPADMAPVRPKCPFAPKPRLTVAIAFAPRASSELASASATIQHSDGAAANLCFATVAAVASTAWP